MFELLDEKIKAQLKNFGIEEPTEAQKKALPKIIEGKNLLLIAPTGIGKTEAAILPIFNKIILEKEKRRLEGFFCIYITPLRALNRDLLRRIEDWGNALNITVGVRHGDTAIGERRKQTKKAPEILITTPETLQILLLGKVLRRHLKNVKAVIIDELHELAFDERGAQLSVALERLKELCGEFQRIGLSATLGNIEEARNYIGNCEVINVYASKKISVDVLYKENFNEQIELLKSLIDRHSHTLIFTNSREGAETLALNLRKIDERIGIHHGSLSKDVRINMEEEFKKGNLKALVCTSSLELGIDIGIIDYVIQFSSPRQVTRLVQRVGRGEHDIKKVSKGAIICINQLDYGESTTIFKMALEARYENEGIRETPLSVLANQIVCFGLEGKRNLEEIYKIIKRAYPFRNLSYEKFFEVSEELRKYGLLWSNEREFNVRKMGREYFYENISMLPDEKKYKVMDIASSTFIGTLDESFVANYIKEDAKFIIKGRSWKVINIDEEKINVIPELSMGAIPSWIGEEIPVPYEVAQELGKNLSSSFLGDYIKNASDKKIVIEQWENLIVIDAFFGTKVNATLSSIIGAFLSSKFGESIGISSDAYRIIIETPKKIEKKIIMDYLTNIKPNELKNILIKILRSAQILNWTLIHTARKFGIIKKDFDYGKFGKILEKLKTGILYEEAVEKLIHEKMDLENTAKVLTAIQSGLITVEFGVLSKFGLEGLEAKRGLIVPEKADFSLLQLVKNRLEREELKLICINCLLSRRVIVGEAEEKINCLGCGGSMLSAIIDDNLIRKVKKGRLLNEEEKKRIKKIYKCANLIREYGKNALFALAGRGIGVDTAAKILRKYRNEYELLKYILIAEVNYTRTRRFW